MTTLADEMLRLVQLGLSPKVAFDYALLEWSPLSAREIGDMRKIQARSVEDNVTGAKEALAPMRPKPPKEPISTATDPVLEYRAKGMTIMRAFCYHLVVDRDYSPERIAGMRDTFPKNIRQAVNLGCEDVGIDLVFDE